MKDKINKIFEAHSHGYGTYDKDAIIKELLLIIGDNQSKQVVRATPKLDCPYDFTSRCTMGNCDCRPKYTNMKNYLLTDFNTERWKGINMESVKSEVEKLNEKIKIGCLFGEIGNPTNFDISLSRASHSIKNLTFEDGKVYGDVEFFDNENGKKADNFINNMNYRFGIRSTGISEQYKDGEIVIHSIFTWDIITE